VIVAVAMADPTAALARVERTSPTWDPADLVSSATATITITITITISGRGLGSGFGRFGLEGGAKEDGLGWVFLREGGALEEHRTLGRLDDPQVLAAVAEAVGEGTKDRGLFVAHVSTILVISEGAKSRIGGPQ
jgi:hypothetical protein